ncbi:UNVERIFIED_CONTAM: hypothetical protein FKN15_002765 [Acipenser sinensis]
MASAAEEIGQITPNSENNLTALSLKITRKNQDRPWKLRFIYLQCCLPVTIAHSGLQPFLVSFVIGFFMQLSGTESILMQDVGDRDSVLNTAEEEEETEDADRGLLSKKKGENPEEECVPNLHILGVLFLSKYMSYAFNHLLVFQFYVYVIPFFTWLLALGILLAQVVVQPVTSLLTHPCSGNTSSSGCCPASHILADSTERNSANSHTGNASPRQPGLLQADSMEIEQTKLSCLGNREFVCRNRVREEILVGKRTVVHLNDLLLGICVVQFPWKH